MSRKGYVSVQIKANLGTQEVITECRDMMGPDEYGRPYSRYMVIHRALERFRDELKQHKPKRRR